VIYTGFDSADYPGDTKMQSIWDNTELRWCGFYLGLTSAWHPHFPKLQDIGWGVAPIYTGKNPGSHKLQAIHNKHAGHPAALFNALWDNGALVDGNEAADQARAANIPLNTILYFDVENAVPDADWLAYYRGWSRAVTDRNYRVGLYTRREHASWLMGKLMGRDSLTRPFDICVPNIWIARYNRANPNGGSIPSKDFLAEPLPAPDPKSVYSSASVWQHIGNFGLKWTDDSGRNHTFAPVDFDSSTYPDPGLGFLSTIT